MGKLKKAPNITTMRKQLLFAFVVLLVVNDVMATRNMRRSNDLQKTSTKNNVKEMPPADAVTMPADEAVTMAPMDDMPTGTVDPAPTCP